jgi:hypothetical protein
MRYTPTDIAGVVVIEPVVHVDARGHFLETFHAQKYAAAGIPSHFVQDNQSMSVRNVLRGLHLQLRKPQGKLVRVAVGEIWDVAVDVRPESPTFGRWFGDAPAGNCRQRDSAGLRPRVLRRERPRAGGTSAPSVTNRATKSGSPSTIQCSRSRGPCVNRWSRRDRRNMRWSDFVTSFRRPQDAREVS